MNAKEFNERYQVGQPVIYHPVIGRPEGFKTTTRSLAWDLRTRRRGRLVNEPVVMVEGRTGCVSLEAIEITEAK